MNFIKCEKLEKSMAELQFSIDAEAFKAAVADVFKKEGKKYPVQGFRKGKAPKALIEKMYGADVFTYDAINELFPAAYEEAVKAAGIEPVGRPEVSVDSASEAEGATLTVKVAVKPEVKIGAYNGLTVEKTVHTVSDEAVEAELQYLRLRAVLVRDRLQQLRDVAAQGQALYVLSQAAELLHRRGLVYRPIALVAEEGHLRKTQKLRRRRELAAHTRHAARLCRYLALGLRQNGEYLVRFLVLGLAQDEAPCRVVHMYRLAVLRGSGQRLAAPSSYFTCSGSGFFSGSRFSRLSSQ